MEFVNHLIGHRKINTGKIAFCKPNATQRNVIDFGILKVAIHKITIRKRHCLKETRSKITFDKSAILKLSFSDFFRCKCLVFVFFVVNKMQSHGFKIWFKNSD